VQIAQAGHWKTRRRNDDHRRGGFFRHPDRNQCQAAIRLPADIGRLTAITLMTDGTNLLAETRMKSVTDNLPRAISLIMGIMSPV